VDDLKAVLAALEADAVPPPPAAFWEAFDARVHAATAALPQPPRVPPAILRPWMAIAGLAAAVVLMFGWSVVQERRASRVMPPASTLTDTAPTRDPSWQTMAEVAATMTADDVRRATAADDATGLLGELSAGERQVFVELLTLEIGAPQ
jgi:hypothetical protein